MNWKNWNRLLKYPVFIAILGSVIWVVYGLYLVSNAETQQDVLFQVDIIVAIVQGASLVFLLFALAKNWEMASAARDAAEASRETLKEMERAREEEYAPYIIIYFDCSLPNDSIHLIIKNTGRTAAKNVKFTPDSPIRSSQEKANKFISEYAPLSKGIPSLAPGQQLHTFVDQYYRYAKSSLPQEYTINVTYEGSLSDKTREDVQILNVSMYQSTMHTEVIKR